jgi:hypothetical protein
MMAAVMMHRLIAFLPIILRCMWIVYMFPLQAHTQGL